MMFFAEISLACTKAQFKRLYRNQRVNDRYKLREGGGGGGIRGEKSRPFKKDGEAYVLFI